MQERPEQENAATDTISFGEVAGGVVVVRVMGRGSFANSMELKRLADKMVEKYGPGNYHFVLDLSDCATMDSTFMGVLASIGLRQKRDGTDRMTIVNANAQSYRLLQTLGLSHFITVRGQTEEETPSVDTTKFQTAEAQDVPKVDRIIHMIEAHQQLCNIDDSNNVRFESVLKYLHQSLEREKDQL